MGVKRDTGGEHPALASGRHDNSHLANDAHVTCLGRKPATLVLTFHLAKPFYAPPPAALLGAAVSLRARTPPSPGSLLLALWDGTTAFRHPEPCDCGSATLFTSPSTWKTGPAGSRRVGGS